MATLEEHLFVKETRYLWWGLGGAVVLLLVFHAGVVVGSHQHGQFRGGFDAPPFGRMPLPSAFIERGHGVVGSIESVALPKFVVEERDNNEVSVEIGSSTVINAPPGMATDTSALMPGLFVVVIGNPSNDADNDIDARIIELTSAPQHH